MKKQYETFSTIVVDKFVKYWLFVLSEMNWEDLKRNISKNVFYITSYGKHEFKSKDVVLIFQKHSTNPKLHGFVAIIQIKENLGENKLNKLNITIFKDINMSKYISSMSALELFEIPYKISQIEHILKNECPSDFKNSSGFTTKYTKEKSIFINLSNKLGYSLLKNLMALSDQKIDQIDLTSKSSKKSSTSSKSVSESELELELESESDDTDDTDDTDNTDTSYYSSSSESNYESESDDDDIRVVIGHEPILMIPCNEFEWCENEFMRIKKFKKHFLECKKCDKIDNNNCNVYPFVNNCIIHCDDMNDITQIDSCLKYYHEGKICKFELEGKDKKDNHMYVFRILSKHHVYHNTILVMW